MSVCTNSPQDSAVLFQEPRPLFAEPITQLDYRRHRNRATSRTAAQSNSTVLTPQIQALLDRSTLGAVDEAEIHIYDLKYIDLGTQKPVKAYKRLLSDHVVNQIQLPNCCQIDLTTFISTESLKIDFPHRLDSEGKPLLQPAEGTVLTTQLVDAENLAETDRVAGNGKGFKRIVVGLGSNGKPEGRWLKFEGLEHDPRSFDDANGHSEDKDFQQKIIGILKHSREGEEALSRTSRRSFAIHFEKRMVQLKDVCQLVENSSVDKQQTRNIISAFTVALAARKLQEAGAAADSISTSGNSAFINDYNEMSCGLVKKQGLEGRLVYSGNNTRPKISFNPQTGLFFPDVPVSDFIVKFFGECSIMNASNETLQKASRILRGVEIIVAVKSGSRKQKYRINSLSLSPIHKPESLHGLKANPSLEDLKYPTMPCVNISTSNSPYYFPAEMCQIQPNQMFHGQLPAWQREDMFSLKRITAEESRPKRSNLALGSDSRRFELIFASCIDLASHSAALDIGPEAWGGFQHELIQCFNAKLKTAVEISKKLSIEYHGNVELLLGKIGPIRERTNGRNQVLVLAIPSSIPTNVVDAIRMHCDVRLGVQCCIVNAYEIEKRSHMPSRPCALIQYTGQVVKKILARTSSTREAGVTADDLAANPQSVAQGIAPTASGRLFGVHIINMKDFRFGDTYGNVPLEMGVYNLVSIVSAGTDHDPGVKTSHHTFKVNANDSSHIISIHDGIAKCLKAHITLFKCKKVATSVIYVSGLPKATQQESRSLMRATCTELCDAHVFQKGHSTHLSLITTTPESSISIGTGQGSVGLFRDTTGADAVTPSAGQDEKDKDESKSPAYYDFGLHKATLARHFQQGDGAREKDCAMKQTSKIRHVQYQYITTPSRANEPKQHFNFRSYLERSSVSDILYLAQRASKRGRLHVFVKEYTGEYKKPSKAEDQPYGVQPLHPNLNDSLYYL